MSKLLRIALITLLVLMLVASTFREAGYRYIDNLQSTLDNLPQNSSVADND